MSLYETEALVLRTYNLAEADKIVVLLSRQAGLLRGVAKGARKIRNRFGAALEPFTLIGLTYYQKEHQELVSVRNAEIIESHFDLLGDPETLAMLAYVGDLILEFCPPHQENDKLLRMVKACLKAIVEGPQDLQLILRYFEVWVLRLGGFLPDVRQCAGCGEQLGEGRTIFVSDDLSLVCQNCVQGKREALSAAVHSRLCATRDQSPATFAAESRELSTRGQREFASLTQRMIDSVLDHRPRVQPVWPPLQSKANA